MSILDRILNLIPYPGETPQQFTARSERLRKRLLAEAAAAKEPRP